MIPSILAKRVNSWLPAAAFAALVLSVMPGVAQETGATPVSVSAQIGGQSHAATAPASEIGGVTYVSLSKLITDLGGACSVTPDRSQVDLAAKSAWLKAGSTHVTASLETFELAYPIVQRGGEVWLSAHDLTPLFKSAFRIDLAQGASPTAPTPPPSAESGESLALEPLAPLSERATTAVEELAPPAAPAADLDALSESLTPLEPLDARQPSAPKQPERSVARGIDVIVINPGHGGNDTGCVGQSGLRECDLTLAIAQRLQQALAQETGAKAILTRDGDSMVSHRQRANLANSNKGDLFLSIHAGGGYAPEAHGCEVFCSAPLPGGAAAPAGGAYTDRSFAVAQRVAPALAKATEASDRGARAIPCQLLKDVSMPGILVEVGFLTNLSEEALLQSEAYQEKIARGIAAGIREYLDGGKSGGEQ